MGKQNEPGSFRGLTFGLRMKITLTFLISGLLLSGALSYTAYRILNTGLLGQVQTRVLDLAQLGARLVDKDAVSRLVALLDPGISPARVDAIESSDDYRTVSDELNGVRAIESKLVHYIYLFAPTADANRALYVVDADVLELKKSEAPQEISHFNSDFDISEYPVARRALAEHVPLVEDAWSYDPDFKVNSTTGYAPVVARDGTFLGTLGIDMVDTDVRGIISNATTVALIVIVAALALTAASSVFLGTLFSRGIVSLERVVRKFDRENLDVRAVVRTRDEVGRLSVSFNAMADTIKQYSVRLEALLSAYGRFVPHELLRLLEKGSILDVKLGDQTQRNMTVLFSDIVSFTSLSETMTPVENFRFLNSYLQRVGPEIRAARGFIDKYIGDAIMALFPEKPDDGLTAAIGMQRQLVQYNAHRRKSGYRPISIGVGVHAGSLMVGTLGEQERMDGSVISDTVNLCSRLQDLTRRYGSTILTTGQTLKLLSDPARFHCRFIDRVRVRGRREAVLIFEVLDGEPEGQREKKIAYRADLAQALRRYYSRDFAGAHQIVLRLLKENPEDEILRMYRKRCDLLLNFGVPEGWQGVEELDAK